MSQEAFGVLFELSRDKVRSFERGTDMKPEVFNEIMNYFDLDHHKFITLDMEFHDVSKNVSTEISKSKKPLKTPNINHILTDNEQYKYLEDLSQDKLLRMCKTLLKSKEEFTKELPDCQALIIRLQKENIDLRISNDKKM